MNPYNEYLHVDMEQMLKNLYKNEISINGMSLQVAS